MQPTAKVCENLNSPSRTWTYDPAVNSRLLYQLSYRGKVWFVASEIIPRPTPRLYSSTNVILKQRGNRDFSRKKLSTTWFWQVSLGRDFPQWEFFGFFWSLAFSGVKSDTRKIHPFVFLAYFGTAMGRLWDGYSWFRWFFWVSPVLLGRFGHKAPFHPKRIYTKYSSADFRR